MHQAALQRNGGTVLKLLLAAAPDLAHSTCEHEDGCYHNWTLLHSAASSGNIEAIRLLLQLAPRLANAVTDNGSTPMHCAVDACSTEAVQLLFEAAPESAAAADFIGYLPMHCAAAEAPVHNLRFLIDAGAPGLGAHTAEGHLPLHVAAENHNPAAVRLLLQAYPVAALVKGQGGALAPAAGAALHS